MHINDTTEWLEADGLGGFASGTSSGVRTRRYHALFLTAVTPPTGRVVLVNGFDAWAETSNGSFALSTQRYAPDVLHPNGIDHLTDFSIDPWPTWQYTLGDGTRIMQETFVQHGAGTVVVMWTLVRADGPVVLRARPFLSGRDYHSLHHQNGAFRFDAERRDASVTFRQYEGVRLRLSSRRTGTTGMRRIGIGNFFTPRNAIAVWTPARICRRPVSSPGCSRARVIRRCGYFEPTSVIL